MTSIISRPNTLTAEQRVIRSNLKLRYNHELCSWEVFTTKHGSDANNMIFRWYLVTAETAAWYQRTFPEIKIEEEIAAPENTFAMTVTL